MKPTFFKSGSAFRAWLETHHHSSTELLVGFYKKTTGIPGITYPEALDEALAFGWIDGIRRSVDEKVYTIRSTLRKATSIWSAVNTNYQAPWYQRTSTHWVMSAKRPETRARRLAALIDYSARGERIPMLTSPIKPDSPKP